MTYENILFDVTGGVATITLNRNDTRNAMSWVMVDDICDALDRLGDARVLVITGAGKGFCSGGDLASTVPEGLDRGQMLQNGLMQSIHPMLLKIDALNIPVVCAVNGAAAGAGAPFALAADLVIAAESAFFLMAFANVGLVPDAGGSWILSRLVGKARAMQMILLAERISAAQAQQWGMIFKVVPDDQLAAETATLARKLADGPTLAYGLARKSVLAGLESDFASALTNEATGQRIAGASKDCDEAIAAFMAGLIGRVCRHKSTRRRGECEYRKVKRLAGAGVDRDILRFQMVLLCEELGELVGFAVDVVASAERCHAGDGFARCLARAQRVLIRVDQDSIGRNRRPGGGSSGWTRAGRLGR